MWATSIWTRSRPFVFRGKPTPQKKLERLKSIYKFAVPRKIAKENLALHLEPPEVKSEPALLYKPQTDAQPLYPV
jgi:hypothetical protein